MEIKNYNKYHFFKYLESIGYNTIGTSGTQVGNWEVKPPRQVDSIWDSLPQFSNFGPTDCFITIDGNKETEIRYGISEGIVLDAGHVSVRSPLPFIGDGHFFVNREAMDFVLKNYAPDIIYKAMFGEKLPINVFDYGN